MSEQLNVTAAQDVHHKLEFYLVALAFTVVGFSVQTSKLSGVIVGDCAEILSWIALILSGLLGLRRLEYMPVAYRTVDFLQDRRERLKRFKLQNAPPQHIKELNEIIEEYQPELDKIEDGIRKKYYCQRIFLVLGLLLLIGGRIIVQTKGMYWGLSSI